MLLRRAKKEPNMPISKFTALRGAGIRARGTSDNRTMVRCELLSDDALFELARSATGIELRHMTNSPVPRDDGWRLTAPLKTMKVTGLEALVDVALLHRLLMRKVCERREDLRRSGRNLLAGMTCRGAKGRDSRILLLVIAPRPVEACDYPLAE
jgi:hypothetical protein